jgi:putative transposase
MVLRSRVVKQLPYVYSWRVAGSTSPSSGAGSKAAGLAMAFKLIESAQRRWRMVNAPHLVALVRAGATFVNGKLVERPEDEAADEAQPEAA